MRTSTRAPAKRLGGIELNLSIVIPFYEKAKPFKKTWERLKPQFTEGDEVILVDDWSTQPFVDEAIRYKLVKPPPLEEHFYRLATLRNIGISEAKNESILILDPDCIPADNFLEKAREVYDVGAVISGRIDRENETGTVTPDARLLKAQPFGDNIFGGVMLFNRVKALNLGGFDERFNGRWGAEDGDFANKAWSSGMSLRFEPTLRVFHQWHERNLTGYTANRVKEAYNFDNYRTKLNYVTPYRPELAVLVFTVYRAAFLHQCLVGLSRVLIPLRIYLVVQGDETPETAEVLNQWAGRWAIKVLEWDTQVPFGESKQIMFKRIRDEGYRLLLVMDDDIYPEEGAVERFLRLIKASPEYHAITGALQKWSDKPEMKGETLEETDGGFKSHPLEMSDALQPCDLVCGGWTVHRLDPLVPHDPEFLIGLEDYDYSLECRKRGLRLGVSGAILGWHKRLFYGKFSPEQRKLYDSLRWRRQDIRHSLEYFAQKWGRKIG